MLQPERPRNLPIDPHTINEGREIFRKITGHQMDETTFILLWARRDAELRYTDPFTGLLNLPGLNTMLATAVSLAKEKNYPLSVIYIDGRRFKKINDHPRLGHAIGNQVILSMATAISQVQEYGITARISEDDDVLTSPRVPHHARPGGDEFAVIAMENLPNAIKLARHLKHKIAEQVDQDIPMIRKHIRGGFKVSTGTAELRRVQSATGEIEFETWQELLKRAEDQMKKEREIESNLIKRASHYLANLKEFLEEHEPSRFLRIPH